MENQETQTDLYKSLGQTSNFLKELYEDLIAGSVETERAEALLNILGVMQDSIDIELEYARHQKIEMQNHQSVLSLVKKLHLVISKVMKEKKSSNNDNLEFANHKEEALELTEQIEAMLEGLKTDKQN